MNCELAKNKIDNLVFNHDSQEMRDISQHIESCKSCQVYFNESLEAKRIIQLTKKEPKLQNPQELINSILNSIDDIKQTPKYNDKTNSQKIIRLIRRTFAAASIGLILIFTIEQYIVFDKISKLEVYISQVPNQPKNRSFQNIFHYNSGFQFGSSKNFFSKIEQLPNNRKLKPRIAFARLYALATNEKITTELMNIKNRQ